MLGLRVEDEVAVDFVRADKEVVLAYQGRQAVEFGAIKDAGERVVRITQQENLGVRLGAGLFELSPIKRPASVYKDHLEFERIAFGENGRRQEGRVDGRGGDDGLAGLGGRADGGVDAGHQGAHESDPLGANLPAMAAAHMVNDGGEDGVTLRGITVDTVGGARLHGGNHCGGRHEIHVGNPARDDVAIGILVPLRAVRPRAFRTAVKIESHSRENLGLKSGAGKCIFCE